MRFFLTSAALGLAVLTTIVTLRWVPTPAATRRAVQAGRSTLDGVYADQQAAAGSTTFESTCRGCHDTIRFTDDAFRENWSGRTAAELFDFLARAEPGGLHGGYDREHYIDLIAYFLRLNDLPSSETDLPTDDQALGDIRLEWN